MNLKSSKTMKALFILVSLLVSAICMIFYLHDDHKSDLRIIKSAMSEEALSNPRTLAKVLGTELSDPSYNQDYQCSSDHPNHYTLEKWDLLTQNKYKKIDFSITRSFIYPKCGEFVRFSSILTIDFKNNYCFTSKEFKSIFSNIRGRVPSMDAKYDVSEYSREYSTYVEGSNNPVVLNIMQLQDKYDKHVCYQNFRIKFQKQG